MGTVYDLISTQYTLSYKPHSSGITSKLGDRHKIQVQFAGGNRFEGYHLAYKHQYNRPDTMVAQRSSTP
jgi:hypothetical protein